MRTPLWKPALVLLLLPATMSARGSVAAGFIAGMHLQETSTGATLGHFMVAPDIMAGRCLTKVSPKYPTGLSVSSASSTVVVRVVVWQSGKVTPVKMISGDPAFQVEAMNAVRLWHYKPFVRDQSPMDVTTDVTVDFVAGKPAGMVTHPHV